MRNLRIVCAVGVKYSLTLNRLYAIVPAWFGRASGAAVYQIHRLPVVIHGTLLVSGSHNWHPSVTKLAKCFNWLEI